MLWVRTNQNQSLESSSRKAADRPKHHRAKASSSSDGSSLSKISRLALRSIGLRANDQIKHANAEAISSSLSASELHKIYLQMSHPHRGIPIKERISSMWSVESAFDGASAVTWLCENVSKLKSRGTTDTRARALAVCQRLMKDGYVYHVNHDRDFEDLPNLYYCFSSEEDRDRELRLSNRSAEQRPVDSYALLAAVRPFTFHRPRPIHSLSLSHSHSCRRSLTLSCGLYWYS